MSNIILLHGCESTVFVNKLSALSWWLCNYLSHYFSKSPTGKWNQQIKNNSVWSFLRFFKVFFFIIVGLLRFWNIEFGNPCSKPAVSNAHSVTVILTGKICEKALQSFTGLTGRRKEKADNVEMRPRGVSWPRLALGGQWSCVNPSFANC